jgi:hypothetical protein
MIKTEFKCLYQVRFETLQYGQPIFNKLVDDPLEIDFQGGAIGIHQTYFNTDVSNSISCKCNIQLPHYFYTGQEWQFINISNNYPLHNYEYIWFASNDLNKFTVTEIDYA